MVCSAHQPTEQQRLKDPTDNVMESSKKNGKVMQSRNGSTPAAV
jgi:hypothetical protein